jgi:hypothetical protein
VVELHGTWDYVGLFALAAVLGAIGGVAYELLLARRGQTGMIERPHPAQKARYYDLGVFANVIVGAIAALAALWVFPPEVKTTITDAGKTVSTTEYDIIKVVGLSLIIGSAGSSFLSAMQARALALVKTQEARTTREVANAQLDQVAASVEADAPKAEVTTQVRTAKAAMESVAASAAGNPDFE